MSSFCYSQSEIYDIGTEILIFHCFATKMLKSFCKSMIFSGICSIFCVLSFCSIKTWFKALWDFFSKICMRHWIRSLSNILPKRPLRDDLLAKKDDFMIENEPFGIWQIQNVEQVQLVSDPILPASETFNQTFKNVKYRKHLKNYMRPWIRSLSTSSHICLITFEICC